MPSQQNAHCTRLILYQTTAFFICLSGIAILDVRVNMLRGNCLALHTLLYTKWRFGSEQLVLDASPEHYLFSRSILL